jgi:hypothetical protein
MKTKIFFKKLKNMINVAYVFNTALFILVCYLSIQLYLNTSHWLNFGTGIAWFLFILMGATSLAYGWVFTFKVVPDFCGYWFTGWSNCKRG